jgi:RNA polymerase sigma-70 factor (sigma-E family)
MSPPWADELVVLYQAQYDRMVRVAFLVCRDAAVAEEVVQEAFVSVHGAWDRVDAPAAYLRTAVLNGCRSWGRRQILERDRRPTSPSATADLGADELWDAIGRLNDRQRAAVVLRFYEDLPDEEIAHLLRCRPATVRTSIHRALAALRKEISR